jgi:predicted phage terminase large subunit-like protein
MAAELAFTEVELLASVCKESLYEFTREFWPVVSSERPVWNWHIEYLCGELQRMAERIFRGLPREYDLIINVSPGTTKSTLLSVMLPAWCWTRMPSFKFIGASYAYALAMELSRKCRDVVKSDKYRACFPSVKIRDEQDSKGFFVNTANGSRYAVGVNGSVTGMHAHLIAVDDPLDPEQSFSEAELKIANRWMTHTLPSRKVDRSVAPLILVQQRLNAGDPTGDMLENAKREGAFPVRHVKLPADDSFDVQPPELKARYVNGLFDPVRPPWPVLKAERARNEFGYVSQYGQDPRPAGSRMFEEYYFNRREKAAPYNSQRIRYWDRAASDGNINPTACYTAGVLTARGPDGNYYVEHVVHGQWEPDERNKRMLACAHRDRSKYGRYEPVIWVEREGGSAGRDAWKGVARALAGFVVKEDSVSGKKEVRAEPWSTQLAAGNVILVEDGTWDVRGYVEEHVMFPHGRLKDRVDASTGAFNLLSDSRKIQPMRIFSMRSRTKKEVKLVVSSPEALPDYRDDAYVLVVRILDLDAPDATLGPPESLENVLEDKTFRFPDFDPEEHQSDWQTPVERYGKLPEQLVISKDDAKKVWAFVLKQRDPHPSRVIFVGDARVALGAAEGVAEALRLPEGSILIHGDPSIGGVGPNRHLKSVIKSSRNLVYG